MDVGVSIISTNYLKKSDVYNYTFLKNKNKKKKENTLGELRNNSLSVTLEMKMRRNS